MSKLTLATVLSTLLFTRVSAQVALPDAASILDRYVKITNSLVPDQPNAVLTLDFSATNSAGATYYATMFRDLAGNLHMAVDDDANPLESGVAEGVVWRWTKQNGVHLFTGKASDRMLAETHAWSAGSLASFAAGWGGTFVFSDWRKAFPTVKTIARATVHNQPCFEVELTRKDGSILHRWFEVKSGLLAQETGSEFDDSGVEHSYTTDITDYDSSMNWKYPSAMQIKWTGGSVAIKINSFSLGRNSGDYAFQIPRDVAKAIAQTNTPAGLPNAMDLLEHFADLTRGTHAKDSIHTQVIKGTLSLTEANLEVPIIQYIADRKNYMSFEIPTMGKFEFGSDGRVGWQRSVVTGPQLVPRSQVSSFAGLGVIDILTWTNEDLNMKTTGKREENGATYYVVEESAPDGTSAKLFFDSKTGYLSRIEGSGANGGKNAGAVLLSDYRLDGGFTTAHHIEASLAGKQLVFTIQETQWNVPIPDSTFKLPDDVAELVSQQKQDAVQSADKDAAAKPTLKRRP